MEDKPSSSNLLDSTCNLSEDRVEASSCGGDLFEILPDHLIVEVLTRLPVVSWVSAACVQKRWAALFRSESLWQTALRKRWPNAERDRRWPGPIGRGSHKRQYIALHTSNYLFSFEDQDGDIHELVGHAYLFLKEQLQVSAPLSYGLLHGTVIDQFLACGKKGHLAHELASQIWLAVIDNLDESEHTFHLLMQIVEEWEVFLPYPYSKSHAVQWRLFERLFTDFRDCLTRFDYYSVLTRAKHKFECIPATWLGY
ncbi:hypothetical protein GOP47_0021754 [Adiantum capillus-veneris]|uniref:F-box domain-containing protein n=1 Tax=Adiantum capillus-veneris TaxID=13818 RepID=A0A9D4U8Y3_ADICA|nr:hypothetical protein GOP47_0021754 [Adiantum capillus-veneris]